VNYCSGCGAKVSLQRISGDERERFVCDDCGTTHYQNPLVLVAAYVCVGSEILWIRRGIAPAVGKWAMPGGYMESDETPEAAACRELLEETGVEVRAEDMTLVSVSSILNMAQTHLVFRCHLHEKPTCYVTQEASEIGWFSQDDLPWADLAFPGIEPHVRQTYEWLDSGAFGIRVGFIDELGSQYRVYPIGENRP